MVSQIDAVDTSITNNLTTIRIRQEFAPVLGTAANHTLNFSNKIYHPHGGHQGSLKSTSFTFFGNQGCTFTDVNGIVQVSRVGGSVIINDNIGTIDYTTGKVQINNFVASALDTTDGKIGISVQPETNDIVPLRNQLITIAEKDVAVLMVDDASTTGTLESTVTPY